MGKNKLAVGLGKLRWKGKTKAQKRAHMKMMADAASWKRKHEAVLKAQKESCQTTS